ncbi:MAG TPA: hypothetical protein VEX13_04485 [Chloroflexia bacterium]|nr:hypothetical protein [Chloroflexia bacterium]
MSTPPRRVPKSATKRRAAARKRTREIGKYIFAYFIIGLLVLGTVSTIFVAQAPVTIAPTITPTTQNNALDTLLTTADQKIAEGDYASGIGFYNAYLAQNPGNADVQYRLGKAYINSPTPDYLAGVDRLQRALSINSAGSFASDAQQLITQYGDLAFQTATALSVITGTVTISGTATISGTGSLTPGATITSSSTITNSIDAAPAITGTVPVTSTNSPIP